MSMDDFKEALHNFAGFAFDHPSQGLLVDTRQFRYRPTPELGIWRDREISPRYVKVGVGKFAYLARPGLVEKMKGQTHGAGRGFDERHRVAHRIVPSENLQK